MSTWYLVHINADGIDASSADVQPLRIYWWMKAHWLNVVAQPQQGNIKAREARWQTLHPPRSCLRIIHKYMYSLTLASCFITIPEGTIDQSAGSRKRRRADPWKRATPHAVSISTLMWRTKHTQPPLTYRCPADDTGDDDD